MKYGTILIMYENNEKENFLNNQKNRCGACNEDLKKIKSHNILFLLIKFL